MILGIKNIKKIVFVLIFIVSVFIIIHNNYFRRNRYIGPAATVVSLDDIHVRSADPQFIFF